MLNLQSSDNVWHPTMSTRVRLHLMELGNWRLSCVREPSGCFVNYNTVVWLVVNQFAMVNVHRVVIVVVVGPTVTQFAHSTLFDSRKILPNKGVCFGCFDTRQHLMTSHDMKACPLKRRLKRLVFLDHQKRGNNFEEYLRQLYSSEMSFVRMVASFVDRTTLGR